MENSSNGLSGKRKKEQQEHRITKATAHSDAESDVITCDDYASEEDGQLAKGPTKKPKYTAKSPKGIWKAPSNGEPSPQTQEAKGTVSVSMRVTSTKLPEFLMVFIDTCREYGWDHKIISYTAPK